MKPFILLTNDDGIDAPGIRFLWEALRPFADLAISAPAKEKSGSGASTTFLHPIRVDSLDWEGTPAWRVDGTPADCVKVATSALLKRKPDLIASGINLGSNSGRNIFYSGTVGATIEGSIKGIPSVAFSVWSEAHEFPIANRYVWPIIADLLQHPLPHGTLLNVNFPEDISYKGVRLARQGKGYWVEAPKPYIHAEGHTMYDLSGGWCHFEEGADCDTTLLRQGYITAVPLYVNELTDHDHILRNKERFNLIQVKTNPTLQADKFSTLDHQSATTPLVEE